MSEHTRRVFLATVAIFLTALATILYITSYKRFHNAGQALQENAEKQYQSAELYPITRFDQCTIYGSQVISYLKTNWDAFPNGICLIKDEESGEIPITDTEHFRTLGHDFYINGNATYYIQLEYNDNRIPNKVIVTLVTPTPTPVI